MSAFFACARKDVLLIAGSGLRAAAAMLLPVLLMLAMYLGLSGTAGKLAYVQSFPIAVRDEDDTPMSRTLIAQIVKLELFSQVYGVKGESDDELIERGYAAVLTLPKDFFYALYGMDNYPVKVVLNGDMQVEAQLFETMIRSVMGIISENQRTELAVFEASGGKLDEASKRELYKQTAQLIIDDALTRQGVFQPGDVGADAQRSQTLFFYASVLSMICMLFPLSAIKTLPEELGLGIVDRLRAAGGSLSAFILSKVLVALLMCLVPAALLTCVIGMQHLFNALCVFLSVYLVSFALFLLLCALLKDASRSQLVGNVFILLFMVLGSGLYPAQLLPEVLRPLSSIAPPYYMLSGMQAADAGVGIANILTQLLPLFIATAIFTALAALKLRIARRRAS